MLKGVTYNSNEVIPLTSVGEGTNGVICMTTRMDCCTNALGETRNGDWYYPNGDGIVPNSLANEAFYRNRGTQQVILNRRNNAMSPTGCFCCELDDPRERICITLSLSSKRLAMHVQSFRSADHAQNMESILVSLFKFSVSTVVSKSRSKAPPPQKCTIETRRVTF